MRISLTASEIEHKLQTCSRTFGQHRSRNFKRILLIGTQSNLFCEQEIVARSRVGKLNHESSTLISVELAAEIVLRIGFARNVGSNETLCLPAVRGALWQHIREGSGIERHRRIGYLRPSGRVIVAGRKA